MITTCLALDAGIRPDGTLALFEPGHIECSGFSGYQKQYGHSIYVPLILRLLEKYPHVYIVDLDEKDRLNLLIDEAFVSEQAKVTRCYFHQLYPSATMPNEGVAIINTTLTDDSFSSQDFALTLMMRKFNRVAIINALPSWQLTRYKSTFMQLAGELASELTPKTTIADEETPDSDLAVPEGQLVIKTDQSTQAKGLVITPHTNLAALLEFLYREGPMPDSVEPEQAIDLRKIVSQGMAAPDRSSPLCIQEFTETQLIKVDRDGTKELRHAAVRLLVLFHKPSSDLSIELVAAYYKPASAPAAIGAPISRETHISSAPTRSSNLRTIVTPKLSAEQLKDLQSQLQALLPLAHHLFSTPTATIARLMLERNNAVSRLLRKNFILFPQDSLATHENIAALTPLGISPIILLLNQIYRHLTAVYTLGDKAELYHAPHAKIFTQKHLLNLLKDFCTEHSLVDQSIKNRLCIFKYFIKGFNQLFPEHYEDRVFFKEWFLDHGVIALAKQAIENKQYNEVLQFYNEALAFKEASTHEKSVFYYCISSIYARQGQYKKSLEAIKECRALRLTAVDPSAEKAAAKLRRVSGIIAIGKRLNQINTAIRGKSLKAIDAIEQYSTIISELVAYSPENKFILGNAHYNLARCYQVIKNFERAKEHAETSLNLRREILPETHTNVNNSFLLLLTCVNDADTASVHHRLGKK